jgi:secretion/DNA translocation related TadE-like protein
VWVLAAGLITVLVALAVVAAGTAMVARHRAQAAADFGALAGALHAIEGDAPACAQAAELVAANGGRLAACQLDGLDVTVTAEVAPAGVAAFAGLARATARAGPVTRGVFGAPVPVRRAPRSVLAMSSSAGSEGGSGIEALKSVSAPSASPLAAAMSVRDVAGSPGRRDLHATDWSATGCRAGPALASAPSTTSRAATAPALSRGSLPLPHLGDWTHEGQPVSQAHSAIAVLVAVNQDAAALKARSAKPAPPR